MNMIHLAGCIMQDEEGKILLLHRNTDKRTQWEIPGGKIDEGEDPARTAEREVEEELGIAIDNLQELDTKEFVEDDHTMKYTWFSARIVCGEPKVMEPETHDKCEFFGLETLETMKQELSPNTINFLQEVAAGRVSL